LLDVNSLSYQLRPSSGFFTFFGVCLHSKQSQMKVAWLILSSSSDSYSCCSGMGSKKHPDIFKKGLERI